MINPQTDASNYIYWENSNHQFHREDGPAVIYPADKNNYIVWFIENKEIK